MTFWSQWSDGTKWVMGIISALLVVVVTATLNGSIHQDARKPSTVRSDDHPAANELQPLPADAVSKLEVTSGLGTPGNSEALWLQVNNASVWTLSAISIRFQFIDPYGALAWDKTVTMSLTQGSTGKPFETSEFSNPNGRSGSPTNGFGYNVKLVGIVAAYGRKL